jgi:hypothetical protein
VPIAFKLRMYTIDGDHATPLADRHPEPVDLGGRID